MASLYAIVFSDQQTAERALVTATDLEGAGYLTILEKALVRKDEHGKVRIDEENHPMRRRAVAGGVLGGVMGAIFGFTVFGPFAGAAVGAGLGAMFGETDLSGDSSGFKSFSDAVSRELPNGGGAVILLGETDDRERVIQHLGSYGGKVHSVSISAEALAELQTELDKFSAGEQKTSQ